MMGSLEGALLRKWKSRLSIPDDYDRFWAFRQWWRDDLPLRKRMQYTDFHTYLPGDILTKVDRVTMAVSLEARVPFLSKQVIELAYSLPESFLYKNGQLKGGLKYAYRDALPQEILYRGKKGFSIPARSWQQSDAVSDIILSEFSKS